MKTETNHIIDKILIEVSTRKVHTANSIKKNIELLLTEEFLPKIELALTMNDPGNVLLRLDKLQLFFTLPEQTDFSNPGTLISAKIEEQIRQQVSAGISEIFTNPSQKEKQQVQHLSQQENHEQIFLFFLENGYFPWFGNRSYIEMYVKNKLWITSFSSTVLIENLTDLLRKQVIFQRFIFQFPVEMVVNFLAAINSKISKSPKFIQEVSDSFSPQANEILMYSLFSISTETSPQKVAYYLENTLLKTGLKQAETHKIVQLLLKVLPETIANSPDFKGMLNKMLAFTEKQDAKNKRTKIISSSGDFQVNVTTEQKETEILKEPNDFERLPSENESDISFFESETNEIHTVNAGLILLHPYLKHFFRAINLLNNENQILQDKKFEAVQILHYLATGEEEFPEGELVFEKFICGFPLNFPVPKRSLITLEMKQEAEVLLSETIKNWPALKNTSPGGMRQMFLQRNGKLIQKKQRFKLKMERKAQDVLLEKLDWNISLVQLPWRNELLTVDW